MAKKTKTPQRPRMHCRPVSQMRGSCASLPSTMRKECEKTTAVAATSRKASKLLSRSLMLSARFSTAVPRTTKTLARRQHSTARVSAGGFHCHREHDVGKNLADGGAQAGLVGCGRGGERAARVAAKDRRHRAATRSGANGGENARGIDA